MTARGRVALAAFGFLLLDFLFSFTRPRERARRAEVITREANREPALRRLDGSAAAFDRRFFFFLESARRRLPADAAGIALLVPAPTEAHRDLAGYQFSPRPVVPFSSGVPGGWILAVYGDARPDGWRELASIPGGALLTRSP